MTKPGMWPLEKEWGVVEAAKQVQESRLRWCGHMMRRKYTNTGT